MLLLKEECVLKLYTKKKKKEKYKRNTPKVPKVHKLYTTLTKLFFVTYIAMGAVGPLYRFPIIRVLRCCIWHVCIVPSIQINQNKHQQFPNDVTLTSYTTKKQKKKTVKNDKICV